MSGPAELWRRRLELVHRSGVLRERLVQHGTALAPAFAVAEQTREAARWLRAHPWVPGLALLWWAWRRPRRAWGWGVKLFRGGRWAWRIARAWQGLR